MNQIYTLINSFLGFMTPKMFACQGLSIPILYTGEKYLKNPFSSKVSLHGITIKIKALINSDIYGNSFSCPNNQKVQECFNYNQDLIKKDSYTIVNTILRTTVKNRGSLYATRNHFISLIRSATASYEPVLSLQQLCKYLTNYLKTFF